MLIVTGANGFIGSEWVRHLNSVGIENIIAVDLVSQEERPLPLAGTKIQQFMTRSQFQRWCESKPKISGCFHFGANSSTTEQNWSLLEELNIEDSQNIWKLCTLNEAPLVYASSAATYGAGELGFDDLLAPQRLKPLNLYGDSKRLFDEWALEQKETPPHWYGLKFFNVFGPTEGHKGFQASVPFKSYHQIRKGNPISLFKSYNPQFRDGEQKRDFISSFQVNLWLDELIKKKPKSGIYNMGTGTARTWLDLVNGLFKAMNQEPRVDFIEMPSSVKNQYQYFTEAKMNKWSQQGLSQPSLSLETALQKMVQVLEERR